MEQLFIDKPWLLILIFLWSLPWKGVALWMSARRGHLGWFIVLIVLNTLAILDILYIFVFSKWRKKKLHKDSNDDGLEEQSHPEVKTMVA